MSEVKKIARVNRGIKKKRDYNNNVNRKKRQLFYNTTKWRSLRNSYLRDNGGMCENCYYNGIIVPATDVHHIISPFTTGYTFERKTELFYDVNNLMMLCQRCHSEYHGGIIKELKSKKYEK